jgi:hypothetical protein
VLHPDGPALPVASRTDRPRSSVLWTGAALGARVACDPVGVRTGGCVHALVCVCARVYVCVSMWVCIGVESVTSRRKDHCAIDQDLFERGPDLIDLVPHFRFDPPQLLERGFVHICVW